MNQVKLPIKLESHQFTMIQNYTNDIESHQFISVDPYLCFYCRVVLRDSELESELGWMVSGERVPRLG
jgi:hypothetical protein